MLNRQETSALIEKLAGNFICTKIVDITSQGNRFEVMKHHYENTDIGCFYAFYLNSLPCIDNRLPPAEALINSTYIPYRLLSHLYPHASYLFELADDAFYFYQTCGAHENDEV